MISTASKSIRRSISTNLTAPLAQVDPRMHEIIQQETNRQRQSIVLIPSENFTSRAVMDALGSVMQNKYSEGYPAARYYGGNQYIDQAESLCQQRALDAFKLDPAEWGVNVQPLSGSPANLHALGAVLQPHDRLMGLDLPHGGHLSHGYQVPGKKISAISVYFDTMPYRLDERTGLIDYDQLELTAGLFRPKVLIAGASAYSRHYDYKRMRAIADGVGAWLLSDMAHVSGLVAAGVHPSPFECSDLVTTTTHKSLRGPRGAMIFFRRGVRKPATAKRPEVLYDLEDKVNFSVFPGHQGGPHNHTISALAVALKQANTQEFHDYQVQVVENAKSMAKIFVDMGYDLVSGGTDTHLFLVDLRSKGIDGARVERVLELVNIAINKNTVPGDKSAMIPSGLRMGTPAMTTRGFGPSDFEKVARFVDEAVKITVNIKKQVHGTKLADFKQALGENGDAFPELADLKKRVVEFAESFPAIV